ncbi:MAG: hypothetical protein KAJ05_00235 [Candidatus Latescibacteria bacterium]|nr:hypothetical protein [Candidatus Latescibacterota bacterium]
MEQMPAVSGHIGPYRTVTLSKIIDPAPETRRCAPQGPEKFREMLL